MKHLQKFYKKGVKVLAIILIGFLSGALGSFVTLQLYQKQGNQATNNNSGTVTQTSYKNENSTTQAVNKVKDAVVSIITYSSSSSRQSSVFNADDTNSDSDNQQIASEGSGVIYKKDDKDAYLVTNTHVINGASKVDIRLADGTKVPGEIVGSDTFSDIAVVKISSEKVTTVAEFGDSSQLSVGETAIAIGSPLGSEYANTVTQGIISSLNRNVSLKSEDGQAISTKAIQTDTARATFSLDDVGFKPFTIIVVDNLNLLACYHIGSIQQVFINGNTTHIMKVCLCDSSTVQLTF